MFAEILTEEQINKFRMLTPLTIEGKQINYKICCNGKFYEDPRGASKIVMFLKDYRCSVLNTDDKTQEALTNHYIKFMIDEFGFEYAHLLPSKYANNLD